MKNTNKLAALKIQLAELDSWKFVDQFWIEERANVVAQIEKLEK